MSKPKQLYWIGDYDADGRPLEYFGGMPGEYEPIPARDLTPEETAALSEAQWNVIDSPTGKRLYRRTDPRESSSEDTRKKAKANDPLAVAPASSTAEPSSTEGSTASSSTQSQPGDTSAHDAESSSP